MGIVALRFYKYFAPLGLKSQLIFYKKYNNLRSDTIAADTRAKRGARGIEAKPPATVRSTERVM
jgi:hypothetical protein